MLVTVIETLYLGALSVWDIKEKKVPVSPLLAGGGVLLCAAIYTCLKGELVLGTLIGGLLPGAFLLLLAGITGRIGMADGVVIMALGAQCGLRDCLLLLFYSLFSLSVFSVLLLILRRADGNTRIPFLPFLLLGYLICQYSGTGQL